jgi:hypothetical protein
MRVWLLALVAAGCVDPDDHDPTGTTGETQTSPTPPPPPHHTHPTTTTTLPTGCDAQEGLSVLSLVATAGEPDTMVELTVSLSGVATAAAACIADDEPDQIFFAESTVPSAKHTIRLSGMFPDADFTCSVAPTCPTQLGPPATVSWHTSIPPMNLRPATVTVDPVLGMTGAWTLAGYALTLFDEEPWMVIWGPDGRVRWWMLLPPGLRMTIEALYHPEDGLIVWGAGYGPEGRVRMVDLWDGEVYAWAPEGWETTTFHHDAKRIADGRLMTLETKWNSSVELDDAWEGFRIRAHHPDTGVVDFDFDSQRLFDEGYLAAPESVIDDDPWHANWIDWRETAKGPRVYVSLCYSEQILALDETTGDLVWLLGEGLGWNVIDAAGAPLPADTLPDCQHGLEVLGDDHLLVYDNGIDTPNSKAEEWLIDGDTKTAQLLWTWTQAQWLQWYLGDIDDLGNDRVLITKAPGPIIEVDKATGIEASRLTLADGGVTYRSERYDGCAFFTSVKECADLAARYEQVRGLLE